MRWLRLKSACDERDTATYISFRRQSVNHCIYDSKSKKNGREGETERNQDARDIGESSRSNMRRLHKNRKRRLTVLAE